MNLALPFSRLAEEKECADLFNTPAKRDGILEDLQQLPLLDQAKLRRPVQPLVVFRFNTYLEFLTARFVLNELRGGTIGDRAFIKFAPLTWETRRMITPNLRVDEHGDMLCRVVEGTRQKHFRDVEYQGSNSLTLVLDKLQDTDVSGEDRQAWYGILRAMRLPHAILRRLDARGAELTGLDFSHCDLQDADFSYAILRNARFVLAELEGTSFQEAGTLLTAAFIRREDAEGARWRLAGGTKNGMLVFWDSASPFSRRSRPHVEAITALDMRRDGGRLYSVSYDGALSATDTDDPYIIRRYPLGMGGLLAMLLTGDSRTVIVGGDRNFVLVRDLDQTAFHHLHMPTSRGAVVTAMALDESRWVLFVGDSDGDLFICDDWRQEAQGRPWGENLGSPVRTLIALMGGALLALTANGRSVLLDDRGYERQDGPDDGPMDAVCYAREVDTLFWLNGQRLMKRDRRASASIAPEVIGALLEPLGKVILACSPDGTFIAAGGTHLVVWCSERTGLRIVRKEPMRMDCAGMILDRSRGLEEKTVKFLVERGAEA